MVYDCFQFYNELDILKIRMNVLKDVVDKFVISESTVTFSGKKKPMYFKENEEMFCEFADKIIYQAVTDTPEGYNPFERDSFQKCAVKRPLETLCTDDDIIIFSDVDEIPNPDVLKAIFADMDKSKIYHLAQRNFYCYLNVEEKSGKLLSVTGEFDYVTQPKWLGTKVCSYSLIKEKNMTTEELRNPDKKAFGVRVDNGGWHFSYMGRQKGEKVSDTVAEKIRSAAHQEFNKWHIMLRLKGRIKNNEDIFGRQADFQKVPIDDTYPIYVREHLDEYRHLIQD